MNLYSVMCQCVFPKNKNILSTVINFRKFNIGVILLSNLTSMLLYFHLI